MVHAWVGAPDWKEVRLTALEGAGAFAPLGALLGALAGAANGALIGAAIGALAGAATGALARGAAGARAGAGTGAAGSTGAGAGANIEVAMDESAFRSTAAEESCTLPAAAEDASAGLPPPAARARSPVLIAACPNPPDHHSMIAW